MPEHGTPKAGNLTLGQGLTPHPWSPETSDSMSLPWATLGRGENAERKEKTSKRTEKVGGGGNGGPLPARRFPPRLR